MQFPIEGCSKTLQKNHYATELVSVPSTEHLQHIATSGILLNHSCTCVSEFTQGTHLYSSLQVILCSPQNSHAYILECAS